MKKNTQEAPLPGKSLLRIITKLKWRHIDGFDKHYYADPHSGLVYSVLTNGKMHELTGTPNSGGYPTVKLKRNGRYMTQLVHRLIAQTFLPNPNDKPIAHHIDHDRLNSEVKNLEWLTAKENANR